MTIALQRSHLLHCVFLLSLIALLGVAPPLAAQQEPAGRVTVVLGTVEAESADGDRRSLGRGDPVFEGDTLHSGRRGRAQIRFSDRGMLSLRPDSVLALDSYRNDAASPASSRQEMRLRRGGFRAQTGGIADANRQGYRVQTPVAVIGIRGTVFDAHQEDGGSLLVGTIEGSVEVRSSAGVIGRIGAGESFDYLRVNPDGSIDFLLQTPEPFTGSPEVGEGEEDEAFGAGATPRSSINTGDGGSESTDGIVADDDEQLVDALIDPDSRGTIAPASEGSGELPRIPARNVLDDAALETLLADDRLGVALGVPSVTVDDNGEVVVGTPVLQGGIATFNSPLLALSSARSGFGAGLATTARADLLAEADLLLLPGSAESSSDQDVGGVPGLIWGRYLAPVTLFIDPSDDQRVLELERDILFMLGTPRDIAPLQGQHAFTVTDFEAVSSGLPVQGINGAGVLDVASARYAGVLDILLGGESATEASLLAEFAADVRGGVLEGLEFGTLDLFDFGTESSVAAEGELAGFFTGDAVEFLQLAFDFRVPSRDDADVAGLVLLARSLDVFDEAQQAALFGDDAVALALGVEPVGMDVAGGALARGIGTVDGGAPILAFDSGASGLGAPDREALLGDADALFRPDSGAFTLEENIEGSGVTWGRFAAPVTQFLDQTDVDARLALDRDLLFALGTPTSIADRQGQFSYELARFDLKSSGQPVSAFFTSGVLDFDAALYRGEIDVLLGEESASGSKFFAAFESGVSAGVLDSVVFETLEFTDFASEESLAAQGDLSGFFTGAESEFLQLAFDFRVASRDDADVAGLALLTQGDELFPSVLSPDQQSAVVGDDAVALALGVEPSGVETSGAGAGVLARGIGTVADGAPLLVFDSAATGLGAADREALIDDGDALFTPDSGAFTLDENVEGSGITWGTFEAPVTQFLDQADAAAALELNRDLLFVLGTPVDVADREGAAFYDLAMSNANSSGLPLLGIDGRAALDFGSGSLLGFLEVDFGTEAAVAEILADFSGSVAAGVLEGLEFQLLEFFDLTTEEAAAVDADLAGFLAGESGAFLQLAFDFRVAGRDDADVSGLALLSEVQEVPGGAATAEEFFALQEDLFFVAVNCCFVDDGQPTGTFVGRATDPAPSMGEDAILAYGVDQGGAPIAVTDPSFADILPDRTVRREGATVAFFDEDAELGLAVFEWQGAELPATAFDSIEGNVLRDFEQQLLVLTGRPTRVADLTGFVRYESVALLQGFASDGMSPIGMPFADMSFNVDFADGSVTDGVLSAPLDFGGDFNNGGDVGGSFDGSFGGSVDGGSTGSAIEISGPTMIAIFEGQVTSEGEQAFVDFDVLGGGLSGEGDDPLDLERSFLEGFFSGESAERFAAAFHLQTQGEFGDPTLAVGNILLEQRDLSLSAFESDIFLEAPYGFVAAGSDLAKVGEAIILSGDEVVFGLNAAGPGQEGFLTLPPAQLLRQAGAQSDLFQTGTFDGLLFEPVRQGVWFGQVSPPLRVAAEDGEILERLGGDFLFFQLALPLDVATLQAAGFTTFAGSSVGINMLPADTLGLGSNDDFSLGADVSFNVDLASGEVHAGQLFVVESVEQVGTSQLLEERGFRVFFDGNIDYGADESFMTLNLTGGEHLGGQPLDLEASSVEGFFSGGEDGLVMLGNYRLVTLAGEGEEPANASGVFSIANVFEIEPGSFQDAEQRLSLTEVQAWERLGIATFSSRNLFSSGPAPGDGLLMGRAPVVTPEDPFVLGGDAPRVVENGQLVSNTRRSDFLAQPFDFVLRQGLATVQNDRFDSDARPDGAPNFAGFEVSWGAWNDPGSGSAPLVQDDPRNPSSTQAVGEAAEVFFASVNPTPTSQLPRTGVFSYGGDAAFIGGGGGSLSSFGRFELAALTASFDLDFASGGISNGAIDLSYEGFSGTTVRWSGLFDGFLNGPVTDLSLSELTVEQGFSGDFGPAMAADLDHSNLSGLLTGPAGERHVGGFSFVYEDLELEQIEMVEGLWVIDQVQGGPR